MIENALSNEVVVSGRFGIEFEANDSEALSLDEAVLRVGLESLGLVREKLEVDGGVASISDLQGLVDRLIWSTRWENHILLRVHLNHRDEWLRTWWEGMSDHSDVKANRRVNVLIESILIF